MNTIEIFGLTIQLEDWEKQNKLPLYIINNFFIQKATINEIKCLALSPQEDLPTIPSLKKQINKIQDIESLPVFLILDTLTEFRKESLIKNKISFILTDKLIYLPFMYTFITDYHNLDMCEKLTKSSQLIYTWMLYEKRDKYYMTEVTKKLNFTNMTTSRSYRQLVSTGLFNEHKEGRKVYLTTKYSKTELFEQVKPFLKSPVDYIGYINKNDINEDMIMAGETALSHYSMLASPRLITYAIDKEKAKNYNIHKELLNIDEQVKIEVWFYNPFFFSEDNQYVDIFSLILSLIDNNDERIEKERDLLLDLLLSNKKD
ncbi:MAG: MarR family transcriptional regulator [Erysipelotrichaceae bacterium]|nr:MarR family transcriptional regulator [Erysipelotrichaceae bacterium]